MIHSGFDKLFYPKSIAVIGASSKKGTLSWELINNLVRYGYNGKIFPINPKAEVIHCFKVYKSVTEIKDDIDLAIVMVSKNYVLSAIDDCYMKKINSVVLITAGFKETGEDGASLEKQLMKKIEKYKIRLIGPNCMGLINTRSDVNMNAVFVKGTPVKGGIGFISQSGALGAAVLATLEKNDIGFSQFISIGNKADITENEILNYWKDNNDVKVITLYLESFADPRKFLEISKEVSKTKPVITIKAARTASGQKAASSHTGALAGAEAIVNTVFEQAGVIRMDTVEDMFDLAKAFDRTVIPEGKRLGILTNAGGPAILTVDEADKWGLDIPVLKTNTVKKLKEIAPEEASLNNPVDLLPPATAEIYGKATEIMLEDENIDVLIIILGPPLMLDTLEIARAISNATKKSPKPSIIVLMSQDENIAKLSQIDPSHPPIFSRAESAARCFGLMYKYATSRIKKDKMVYEPKVNKNKVKKILNDLPKGNYYLDFIDIYEILKNYDLPVITSYLAKNAQESVIIAEKMGYPIVIKAIAKDLIHKTDAGGVVVDIKNTEELVNAENKVLSKLREKELDKNFEGFLIQPYMKGGIETIFGVTKDRGAGHLIMFGLGGIFVEVLKDVSFRILPIEYDDASQMVKSIKGYKILEGIRGNPPVDFDCIIENMLKLSKLVSDFPEILEIDFNPFIVSNDRNKFKILDARIKVRL
ncbi:MAG: acetate--CoA ligase family protein [Ignavibacteria bacterium]|nr:acetate--CoA ligase family protein [Ignavibacteria bacterium]